jgi:hypothetical protein
LLTNGYDTASQDDTLRDSLAIVRQTGTPVYVLGLGSLLFRFDLVRELGTQTGGAFFLASSPNDLEARYRDIAHLLQSQYRLQFTSRHGADGANHVLAVGVGIGGPQVQGEKEYLAPQ